MTNSHLPKSTEAKVARAVSLCSFSSWFASHVHILHCLDSMFTSAPARATTPTQVFLCFCTSFCETGTTGSGTSFFERNWSNSQRCSDAWRCNHEGKRTGPRLLRSQLQWIWQSSTRHSSLSGSRFNGQCIQGQVFSGFNISHRNKSL